jgi:hypothetical protein
MVGAGGALLPADVGVGLDESGFAAGTLGQLKLALRVLVVCEGVDHLFGLSGEYL